MGRIIHEFPDIGETIEKFVQERSVCADAWQRTGMLTLDGNEAVGGTAPETTKIWTHIWSYHNFFPLSSVQILLILACCLLCVL